MTNWKNATQGLYNCFISASNAIRVSITGSMSLTLTDSDDAVKIGNGIGVYVAVNSDGSLNVKNLTVVGFND